MADDASAALATVTSTTLLEGLGDPANQTVWAQYVERYRPIIMGFARRLGCGAEDAEDVAQAALLSFASAYRDGRYDPARGRLSSWLLGIVTNEVRTWMRRKQRRAALAHFTDRSGLLDGLPAEDELGALWDRQWRAVILRTCLDEVRREVRPETMTAFERFALQGRSAEDVARELGTSANAVFSAKRRVLNRLRELRPALEEAWS